MKNKKRIKYSPKYFRDNMPEWKRKKDPPLSRIFYRPLSFVFSSLFSNLGITANDVSYFSIIVALSSCVMFLIQNHVCHIIAAILTNIWLLFDCIDGNIARSVKKQPFGEFADGISSYILVAFLCTSMGISVYFSGGAIVDKHCIWIVLLGALASTSDTLMRLIYQKYKSTERELADEGIIEIENDNPKINININ